MTTDTSIDPLSKPPARCVICNMANWQSVYRGPVRAGKFGEWTAGHVWQCANCAVRRLLSIEGPDAAQKSADYWADYWRGMAAGDHASGFSGKEDMEREDLASLWRSGIARAAVLDVGCGPGAFIDHMIGLPEGDRPTSIVGIEPGTGVGDGPRKGGVPIFDTVQAFLAQPERPAIDTAFVLNTLEHSENPLQLLTDVVATLAPQGRIFLATSNYGDLVMSLAPDGYRRFAYRAAQRWYFDLTSLSALTQRAGLRSTDVVFVHRYGIGNAMGWMRSGKPTGNEHPSDLDAKWKAGLERIGASDRFYVMLERAA